MLRCVLGALLGASFIAPAAAQLPRQFPATALRGVFMVVQPPEVQLNGKPARLAPGARIRGAHGMLQMSGSLIGHKLLVHYTIDSSGNLHDVWVLTPAEAARKPWPTTPAEAQHWSFDWGAQHWTKQ
ncbi:hypothetical protein HLB44_06670 [Aquincola sp. S2]|uniref:Uncharacterized protein n=1 Tax=Pseudaquabacterium terrae TaxID=2732868 RepID=A0ABX2EDS2_9BURK|nr:hypothetical protein [Aquabacterium terrae]NRF66662.1 hypothetical protein [Aquabacterium terrae]